MVFLFKHLDVPRKMAAISSFWLIETSFSTVMSSESISILAFAAFFGAGMGIGADVEVVPDVEADILASALLVACWGGGCLGKSSGSCISPALSIKAARPPIPDMWGGTGVGEARGLVVRIFRILRPLKGKLASDSNCNESSDVDDALVSASGFFCSGETRVCG